MVNDGGFFEEMNIDDVEEIELSSCEESFDNIDDFKESAIYAETNDVLREVKEDNNDSESDPYYSSEDFDSDVSQAENVRVIYVNKSLVSNNSESISDNTIVLLDSSQFEILVNKIDDLSDQGGRQAVTVSMNDYSDRLDNIQTSTDGILLVNIMLFALCFGYFVKETVFRGL